jgi:hypothetical protein
MDTSRLVKMRTFSNEVDADIAKQHLVSAGIQAFVRKDDYGGMQPYLQTAQGVFLEVLEDDRQQAEVVLKARNI